MNHPTVYFDNNATTELCAESQAAMNEELKSPPANPSSGHQFGRNAKKKLNSARWIVSSFLGVASEEIIFNSGGTEGLNFLIRSLAHQGTLLTTQIEHSAILNTLETVKCSVEYIPVDETGAPSVFNIEKMITPETSALILSAVNSETGVKIDLNAIASLAQKHAITFIVDGVALLGKRVIFYSRRGECNGFFGA